MKILHLSDTHGAHHRLKNLPNADIVVHSGDFCMVGEESHYVCIRLADGALNGGCLPPCR